MSTDATMSTAPPRPRSSAPALRFDLVGGGPWDLAEQAPRHFTMVVFYRGRHCPVCASQLAAVDERDGQLRELGVEAIAVSADDEGRATRSRAEWGISRIPMGYGLDLPTMRSWGLFVSKSTTEEEAEHFAEPATFLVTPSHDIYYASLTSMPFGRPQIDELMGGIEFVTGSGYPGRGDR